jgi:RHS repeat-associated protein
VTLRAAPSGQSLHGLSLLAEQQGSGPAAWSYYLPDALGSVRQVADPTGQVTLAQAYDPFGNLVYQSTHLPISPRYGFAGEEQDPLTGQVFLRARSYAPSTGRFLQADPLPGLPGQPGGLALPALVAQAQVSRVEGLHRYAYAFNNPVNYVDPAGTLPLFNGIQSPLSYRQDLSRLRGWAGQPLAPGGYASRSANAVGRGLRAWARQSEPLARFLSRGHRGLGCGFIGLVNSAGSIADYLDSFSRDPGSALSQLLRQANGNLRQGLRDLRDPDQWRQAYHDFLPLWYDYGGMVIGLLPIVGGIYDVVSLALERDLISGRPLTTTDRAIMSAGLLFSTLGFVDEALEGGSRLLRHLDELDAAGVGRGLSHLDEATAFRLGHLDEFTAGDRALLRGDELRRALGSFDEGGALRRWQDVTDAWARAGADLQDPTIRRLIREDKFPIKGGSGSFGDAVVRAVKWNPHTQRWHDLGTNRIASWEEARVRPKIVDRPPGRAVEIDEAEEFSGIPREYLERFQDIGRQTQTDLLFRETNAMMGTRRWDTIPKDTTVSVRHPETLKPLHVSSMERIKFKTNKYGIVQTRLKVRGQTYTYGVVGHAIRRPGGGFDLSEEFDLMPMNRIIDERTGQIILDPREGIPMGPDVDTYAFLKRTKSGYVNLVTDTPGEIGLRKQLQSVTIDPRQVVPGEHIKFTAITHGPYHTWATQDPSRPVVKGPVLVFAEDVGQFYWLKEHEIQAWYAYRGVSFP